jgi:hypothetical protein
MQKRKRHINPIDMNIADGIKIPWPAEETGMIEFYFCNLVAIWSTAFFLLLVVESKKIADNC